MIKIKKLKSVIKSDKAYRITVTVLTLTALVLGYLIIKDSGSVNIKLPQMSSTTDESDADNSSQSVVTEAFDESDMQDVLIFPSQDASDEEKQKHAELVQKLAKEGNEVDISGCKPEPMVLRTGEEGSFKFVNTDEDDRVILWSEDEYNVPAKSEVNIKVSDFAKFGLGDYGYTCDGTLAGIISVSL